ncbi:MAG: hypothetical protein MR286_10550 [Clostridiales bacterium]|nr:hypothetical protein [Clostridiales bacterium]
MKTVVFISSNKVLGQGLSAAMQPRPELKFQWVAQLNDPLAVLGIDVFHADVVILDIVDQADMDRSVEICQTVRRKKWDVKILLLVRPGQAGVRNVAVDAKNRGLADDFVFYDSSLTYLLAKLEAL